MKIIFIDKAFNAKNKTKFLREFEKILIKHNLLAQKQVKKYRNDVAYELIELMNSVNSELAEHQVTLI